MKDDNHYMHLAIELAKKGKYFASPNPLVGCVIVKNNEVIASGYHAKFGENHAEINALGKNQF
jgi:diaminohydroxyphosphoribosylaminopyrimidine deaminase/5-amino-6-(5-phosphoribosylamino)uracil reductase